MKRLSADNRIMSRSTPISPDFSAYLVAFQQTLVRGSAHNILVCSLVVLYTTFQALSWLNLLKALAHILCGLHAKMQTVLASPSHKKGFGSIMAFIICRCELKVYEGEKEKGVLTNDGVTHCFSKACHILSQLLFGGLGCMMKELCASFFLHHHQCDICRVYNDFLFLHSTHATSVISFTTSSSPNESNSANFL